MRPIKISIMDRKETNKKELIKLGIMLILSAVLAACSPTRAEQETQPAITQTIIASETEVVRPTPEASSTPENTSTATATATLEVTLTPQAIEFPTNLSEFISREQSPLPLYSSEWGPYETKMILAVKMRPEEMHYEKFTLLNGRYLVLGWMDAWWQERAEGDEPGEIHHLAIPYQVFDTQTKLNWWVIANIINNIEDELYIALTENWSLEELMREDIPHTENGDFIGRDNLGLYFGAMPDQEISSSHRDFVYIKSFIDFWQPLLADIYTAEVIEQFAQTGDTSVLNLETISDGYLPQDFVLPLKPEP